MSSTGIGSQADSKAFPLRQLFVLGMFLKLVRNMGFSSSETIILPRGASSNSILLQVYAEYANR